MFLKDPFKEEKSFVKFTNKSILDKCPDCGNPNLSAITSIRSGDKNTNNKSGLYCSKCKCVWAKE